MRLHASIAVLALLAGVGSACFADITGTVVLKGNIPPRAVLPIVGNPDCARLHNGPILDESVVAGNNGQLANVVVSIRTPEGTVLAGGNPAPAVLDQKACVYVPHVVVVQVGSTVIVKNSDPTLHNVHTLPIDNNATNVAMVGGAPVWTLGPYRAVEDFKVRCDVHPWMTAWIRVVDSPYFAVTTTNGTYTINTAGLADGDYELIFWQEKYHELTKKITVKGGKAVADAAYNT